MLFADSSLEAASSGGECSVFLSLPTVVALVSRFHAAHCGPHARVIAVHHRAAENRSAPVDVRLQCEQCQLCSDQIIDETPLASSPPTLSSSSSGSLRDVTATTRMTTAAARPTLVTSQDEAGVCSAQLPAAGQTRSQHAPVTAAVASAEYGGVRCEVCSKNFAKKSNLRVHMLKHLGVRPYFCDKCGKSFADPSTLSRHVNSVCGDRRSLRCRICGKLFYHKSHFKEHCRKHTGEKPFVCEKCGCSYIWRSSLRRHLAQHAASDSVNLQCVHCGRRFKRARGLLLHRCASDSTRNTTSLEHATQPTDSHCHETSHVVCCLASESSPALALARPADEHYLVADELTAQVTLLDTHVTAAPVLSPVDDHDAPPLNRRISESELPDISKL